MGNVIPWEYVKLRIACQERQRAIVAFYKARKSPEGVSPEILQRCYQSDTMLTEAFQAFEVK